LDSAQQAAVDALIELFDASKVHKQSSVLNTISTRLDNDSVALASFFQSILAFRRIKEYPDITVFTKWTTHLLQLARNSASIHVCGHYSKIAASLINKQPSAHDHFKLVLRDMLHTLDTPQDVTAFSWLTRCFILLSDTQALEMLKECVQHLMDKRALLLMAFDIIVSEQDHLLAAHDFTRKRVHRPI
jgi:hypothetical protein